MAVKESTIQDQVEKYCDLKGMRYVRFPDSLYRWIFSNPKIPIWIKKQCSDYMKGVPDMIILTPSQDYNNCLLLEIKKEGGRLTQGQKNWHKGLRVEVCYGFEECKEAIDKFMEVE